MIKKRVEGGKILEIGLRAVRSGKCLLLFLAACCLFSAALVSPALAQDKIGIAPFTVFGPQELQYMKDALPQMLYSRLPYGAKEIVGKDAFRDAVKGLENKDELAQARKIMEAADYRYLVMGAYTKMGEAFSVDVKVLKKGGADFKAIYVSMDKEGKIFSAVEGLSKQVAAIIGASESQPKAASVDAPVVKDLPAPVAAKAGAAANAFQRLMSSEIHFPPTAGVCLADVDGDGKKELVTGGNNTIYVYRIDDVQLNLLSTFNLRGYDVLSINCGDFDKNGRDEVYATAIRADDAVTVVLEGTAAGQLQRQSEADGYVRVINHPLEGELLLGQKMGQDKAFDGEIYRLGYSKTAGLAARSPFEFKGQLNLYQIQPIKYRGKNGLAFFDEGDYLKIMDEKGKVVERLKERYGGSVRAVQKGLDTALEKNHSSLYQRIIRVADGNTDAILVLKNEGNRLFSRYRSFDRGQVAYLKFDETNFKEASVSEIMDGYLSDVAVDRKSGKLYVTAVTENKAGRIFIFSSGQSRQ